MSQHYHESIPGYQLDPLRVPRPTMDPSATIELDLGSPLADQLRLKLTEYSMRAERLTVIAPYHPYFAIERMKHLILANVLVHGQLTETTAYTEAVESNITKEPQVQRSILRRMGYLNTALEGQPVQPDVSPEEYSDVAQDLLYQAFAVIHAYASGAADTVIGGTRLPPSLE